MKRDELLNSILSPLKIKRAWNRFFSSFETRKAKILKSKRKKFFWNVFGFFITGEYLCDKCHMSDLVRELPGEFRDWDADSEQGGDGIPLCTKCLGTGKYRKRGYFKELQEKANKIRKENMKLLGERFHEEKICKEDYYNGIEKNNDILIEISQKALGLVNFPDKNCLALIYRKEQR